MTGKRTPQQKPEVYWHRGSQVSTINTGSNNGKFTTPFGFYNELGGELDALKAKGKTMKIRKAKVCFEISCIHPITGRIVLVKVDKDTSAVSAEFQAVYKVEDIIDASLGAYIADIGRVAYPVLIGRDGGTDNIYRTKFGGNIKGPLQRFVDNYSQQDDMNQDPYSVFVGIISTCIFSVQTHKIESWIEIEYDEVALPTQKVAL